MEVKTKNLADYMADIWLGKEWEESIYFEQEYFQNSKTLYLLF